MNRVYRPARGPGTLPAAPVRSPTSRRRHVSRGRSDGRDARLDSPETPVHRRPLSEIEANGGLCNTLLGSTVRAPTGAEEPLRFELETVDLELQVTVTARGAAEAKVGLWSVLTAGTSADYSRGSVHKLTLKPTPRHTDASNGDKLLNWPASIRTPSWRPTSIP
ncbi:trypco2 family protein [Streptomyces sp. YU58]|uniref:trypco2 family protein n=1 Tax=Streptomyces sp. SX92 TaxID=3158972 RepID=UPI0027BA2002|nr:trypco2 family protein [Streptomyces coralus]WLW50074.1 trypco2 family protein [Streptomyces coralus]